MFTSIRSLPRVLGMVLILAVLAGCGSGVQFVRMDPVKYPSKSKDTPVQIFRGEVMKPHTVIGTLTAKKTMKAAFDDKSTYDGVMKTLKDYARKIGADALIEVQPLTSDDGGLNTKVVLTAKAVRFFEREMTISSQSR